MLHDGRAIRVAVCGGSRIPFCRSHSVYKGVSNQEMMTAALQGVVSKFDLKGQMLGEVVLGAVIKHSRDWNLARESVIDSGFRSNTHSLARNGNRSHDTARIPHDQHDGQRVAPPQRRLGRPI